MLMQGRTIDVRRHGLTSTASTDFGSVRNLDFEEGSARAKRRGRSLKRAVGIICAHIHSCKSVSPKKAELLSLSASFLLSFLHDFILVISLANTPSLSRPSCNVDGLRVACVQSTQPLRVCNHVPHLYIRVCNHVLHSACNHHLGLPNGECRICRIAE